MDVISLELKNGSHCIFVFFLCPLLILQSAKTNITLKIAVSTKPPGRPVFAKFIG